MKIVVRFRYYKAVTPSCDIVELTDEQWREFLSLENATKRRDYMIALLERGFLNIKELWWIPLEDNMELKIKKSKKKPHKKWIHFTKQEIEQYRKAYQSELLRMNEEEPIAQDLLEDLLNDLSDMEINELLNYGCSPESTAELHLYYN